MPAERLDSNKFVSVNRITSGWMVDDLNLEPFLIGGVVISVVIAIVIIGAVVSHKLEKKRTEQLAQTAAEMGFAFEPDGSGVGGVVLAELPLFNRGHSKKTTNVMQKIVRGECVLLLDHQYTVGSGKSQQTYKHKVAVFGPKDHAAFPDFEMCPESFWHQGA